MPAINYEQAREQLDAALAANKKALLVQATSAHGRSVQRANLADIQRSIEYWENKVDGLSPDAQPSIRVMEIIPR